MSLKIFATQPYHLDEDAAIAPTVFFTDERRVGVKSASPCRVA
jgi:hypothetical protein